MSISKISMRYPPFDRDSANPEMIQPVECLLKSEIKNSIKIGSTSDWYAHWTPLEEDPSDIAVELPLTNAPSDLIISKRRGWFIKPDPLHKISRRILPYGVFAIIAALSIQAFFGGILEDIPLFGGILSEPVSFGPLDYPAILLIAFPIFIVPIFLRVASNLRDLRKQRSWLSDPILPLEVQTKWKGDGVEIEFLSIPEEVSLSHARLVVGMPVPERESILNMVGRERDGQPPPGLSTPTPVSRIALGESDGTNVGETVPMSSDNSGTLVLEPLRVSDPGMWVPVKVDSRIMFLPEPENLWPGSIYSPLFTVHWEIQVIGKRAARGLSIGKQIRHGVSEGGLDIGWAQEQSVPMRGDDIDIPFMPLSGVMDLDPLGGWPES
tara:strand:+ start:2898 stop:4040 length:1143 start_codon:yes stop_codon:yes gene_type:complete